MFYRPHSRLNSLASISSYASSDTASTTSSNSSFDSSFDPATPSPTSSASLSGYGPESRASLLVSAFIPEDILHAHDVPRFQRCQIPFAINLRNFRIQSSKWASISDIVVYSADGLASPDLLTTAERFLEAQDAMRASRVKDSDCEQDLVEYNVFVVADRFDVFEQFYPELVAVDSLGYLRNKIDFFEREKEEMRVLTEASPIADGVWLGNTQDVPIAQKRSGCQASLTDDLGVLAAALENNDISLSAPLNRTRILSSDSSSSLDREEMEDGNPHGFSICIESHDKALMASTEALKGYEEMLDTIHQQAKPGQSVDPAQIMHLECLSTGEACVTSNSLLQL